MHSELCVETKHLVSNTLIMEWEATYPFSKHPLIPNKYAYRKSEIVSFINIAMMRASTLFPCNKALGM